MTDSSRLSWYIQRLGRMSPGEVAWRVREQTLRRAWARRQVLPGQLPVGPVAGSLPRGERRFSVVLPPETASLVPETAREAIVADADRILKGEWEMLSVVRGDMDEPDWFYDPVTGRRCDPGKYAFDINQRAEEQVGNIRTADQHEKDGCGHQHPKTAPRGAHRSVTQEIQSQRAVAIGRRELPRQRIADRSEILPRLRQRIAWA